MPIFDSQSIQSVIVHRVGNKQTEEGIVLSPKPLVLNEQLQDLFVTFFIQPFKAEEYYHLYHDDNLLLNTVYQQAVDIFDNPECLPEASQSIARHLYDACLHPNIKGGDLFVVYFHDCQLEGETLDAVGLFKSENKEPFLKVLHDSEEWDSHDEADFAFSQFRIEPDKGININKLDKGAIIFNTQRDDGFLVSVVDASNHSTDAVYWKDNFLQIKQCEDEYFNTHQAMNAYKDFVTKELPQQFADVSKADCVELLNRGAKFFKENQNFDLDQFNQEVISQPEVIDKFQQYRQQYQEDNNIDLPENFNIHEAAVKKDARGYKNVIKLDKNFHIYVHGHPDLIEQGVDERGKYYKVYYEEEN